MFVVLRTVASVIFLDEINDRVGCDWFLVRVDEGGTKTDKERVDQEWRRVHVTSSIAVG